METETLSMNPAYSKEQVAVENRRIALTAATRIHGWGDTKEDVLEIAKRFERFLSGESD